jgi:hypothetical protein
MQILEVQPGEAAVKISRTELMIRNNALNEVCNGIDVPEFATRLGATLAEVRQLLKQVADLLGHQERLR